MRLCMLVLINIGFMGKQLTHVIEHDYMHTVEDFGVFDRYLGGILFGPELMSSWIRGWRPG